MVKSVDNLILDKVDNLVGFIKDSQEYKDYVFLSNKLATNRKVNDYINKIKSLQKEIVKKEVIGEDISELEIEIKSLLEKLDKIPLYKEFIDKQEELNEIYQLVKQRLDEYFYNILN